MALAMNVVMLGMTGVLSVPAIKNMFFPTGEEQNIVVRISAGDKNSDYPGADPGGDCPSVALYRVTGDVIGIAHGNSRNLLDDKDTTRGIQNGGNQKLTIEGSQNPEYVKIIAFGNDAVCVSSIQTTSPSNDFRTWMATTGVFCGLPWYPSEAFFSGLATPTPPPCIWMSADNRFIHGISARLTDFTLDDASIANVTSAQWTKFPDTLCSAPARQQFWTKTELADCIPFYPDGHAPQKNASGFDSDFEAVKSSYSIACNPGTPLSNIPLNTPNVVDPNAPFIPPTNMPTIIIPSTVTLQKSLDLGHLARRSVPTTTGDAVFQATSTVSPTPAPPMRPRQVVKVPLNAPVHQRRLEHRDDNPHQWCDEGKIVISEIKGHSAVEVCESETSWGPDFISIYERFYCDMC